MELISGCLLLAAVILLYYYFTGNFGYWEKQKLKCRKPWPIIGTLTPYWKKTLVEQDDENYQKFGSIYGYYEGSRPALLVGDPELLRLIFVKDFAVFPDRRDAGLDKDNLICKFLSLLKGEEWKATRHALSPSFSSKRLKPFLQSMDESAEVFKSIVEKHITTNEPFCFRNLFSRFCLDALGSYALGLQINSLQDPTSPVFTKLQTLFTQTSETAIFLFACFPSFFKWLALVMPVKDQMQKDFHYLNNVMRKLISMRLQKQEHRNDGLDVLLKHKDELHPDIISMQGLLFLTGGESQGTILAITCYELALNPDIQEKLISEIDEVRARTKGKLSYEDIRSMEYLDMVVMESLRKYPPLHRLERTCIEEGYQLNGIKLRKGTVVGIPVYSIHHDEKYFPDAQKFDPDRFNRENKAKLVPFTYMPFGLGPRGCIASRLGLLAVKLPLVHFFSNYRVMRAPETQVPLKLKAFSFGTVVPTSIYLRAEKRTDLPQWI